VAEISRHINECLEQTRNLARGLFPVELEQDGLISALEELARRTRTQYGRSEKTNHAPVLSGESPDNG
jgi:signal transduction histidine kinase